MSSIAPGYREIMTDKGPYFLDFRLIEYIWSTCTYMKTMNGFDLKSVDHGWGMPTTYEMPEDNYHTAHIRSKEAEWWYPRYGVPDPGGYSTFFQNVKDIYNQRSSARPKVLASNIERLRDDLLQLEKEHKKNSRQYKRKWAIATKAGTDSINASVENWGTAVAGAQLVRDLSTEFLIVAGCALTGPLGGIAVRAGGAVLKGGAKWQDTGNFEAGVMTATTGIVVAVIPTKGGTKAESIALTLVSKGIKLQGDVAVGLIEGKDLGEAFLESSVNLVVDEGLGKIGGKFADKIVFDVLPKDLAGKIILHSASKTSIPTNIVTTGLKYGQGKMTDGITKIAMDNIKSRKTVTNQPMKKTKAVAEFIVHSAVLGPWQSSIRR